MLSLHFGADAARRAAKILQPQPKRIAHFVEYANSYF